jgi:glycerol-3-phosphate acyltransferase PlsY
MTTTGQLLALIPVAYLLGSVPFGLIVGLSRGVDPRTAGSGNIGATNVGRLLGGKFFALVFTLDLLKGLVPTLAASWIVHRHPQPPDWRVCVLWLLVGFAAIAGHMFSAFLKFKGGKGVATSAGVMLGVWPYYTIPATGAIAVWGIVFARWRIISLASMIAAVAFPVVYAIVWGIRGQLLGDRWPLPAFAVLVAVMVVWKHRSNIARLRAGTEAKFTTKKRTEHPTSNPSTSSGQAVQLSTSKEEART